MKRLALLLAAIGVVSVTAMAESPKLEVTHIGQEIEIENSDGGADVDSIFFANTVGLSYKDWSFSVTGGKFWSYDGDDGIKSTDGRLQFDIWKPVTETLKLGTRFRLQDDYDRYYLNWDWNNGLFYSFSEAWYEAANSSDNHNTADSLNMEAQLLGVRYGRFAVSYYLGYYKFFGTQAQDATDYEVEHQVRLFADLYKGERFSLSTEVRVTIADDVETEGSNQKYREYDDFGRTRIYLRPSYKVSDALTVYGYYGYEFKDRDYKNGATRSDYHTENDNYQDIGLGWSYTF